MDFESFKQSIFNFTSVPISGLNLVVNTDDFTVECNPEYSFFSSVTSDSKNNYKFSLLNTNSNGKCKYEIDINNLVLSFYNDEKEINAWYVYKLNPWLSLLATSKDIAFTLSHVSENNKFNINFAITKNLFHGSWTQKRWAINFTSGDNLLDMYIKVPFFGNKIELGLLELEGKRRYIINFDSFLLKTDDLYPMKIQFGYDIASSFVYFMRYDNVRVKYKRFLAYLSALFYTDIFSCQLQTSVKINPTSPVSLEAGFLNNKFSHCIVDCQFTRNFSFGVSYNNNDAEKGKFGFHLNYDINGYQGHSLMSSFK